MNSEQTVYRYTDLLAFLEDAKDRQQKTYSSLADELGISSRTKIKKMFKGEVAIPQKTLKELGEKLGLLKDEITYLDTLRVFNQTNDPEMAVTLFGKMVALRKKNRVDYNEHALDERQHRLLEKWFYLPVLYFLALKGVDSDPFGVARAFHGKLTLDEVNEALKLLLEINLIEYTPTGRLVPVHENVNLLDGIPRPLVKRFHSMMIEQAQDAIFNQPIDKRYLMSSTLNVKKEMLPKLREKIREFMIELDRDFTSPDADTIYQANIQLFNMAEVRAQSISSDQDD